VCNWTNARTSLMQLGTNCGGYGVVDQRSLVDDGGPRWSVRGADNWGWYYWRGHHRRKDGRPPRSEMSVASLLPREFVGTDNGGCSCCGCVQTPLGLEQCCAAAGERACLLRRQVDCIGQTGRSKPGFEVGHGLLGRPRAETGNSEVVFARRRGRPESGDSGREGLN
jgi:hypothetical protein